MIKIEHLRKEYPNTVPLKDVNVEINDGDVIRDLAKTGKTMMIITHEMNFARAISNRVFYIDEGSIYEEGTPEQIFNNPQREKTRRFIQKLKVSELKIDSNDYDFLSVQSEIVKYCNKNQIPSKLGNHIQLVYEELVQQILIPMLPDPHIFTEIEYSESEEAAVFSVQYNGPPFDVTKKGNDLSLKILRNASA